MSSYNFAIASSSNDAVFVAENATNGLTVISSLSAPPINTWELLTATIDGSGNVYFYVNGVQQNASAGSLGGPLQNEVSGFRIGNDTSGDGLNGYIDDLRIYNRVLAPAEVQAIYNAAI